MENEFENAKNATEDLFDASLAEEREEQTEEVQEETNPAEEREAVTETLNEAVQTAETATETAAEKNNQLMQVLEELEAVKQQNETLQDTISQMSQKQKEAIVEQALEMPVLDVNSLAFADEETVKNAQSEYARKMAEFIKDDVMKEMSPFVEQAKEGMYQKEKNEVISALSQIPELTGIETMVPQLDRIIKNNKALFSENIPVDEKYITAYAIARGVNSINTPPEEAKEPTPEELMELYDKNPAFQELLEKKRLQEIKKSQQVPPLSSSSGAVNAALNIKEKPKTFEEASKRTREMFGLS